MRRGWLLIGAWAWPLLTSAESIQHEKSEQVFTEMTAIDQRRAEAWGLNAEEWERYETLMATQRGLWTPDLDPLMVLGIHARTESERRRYAEMVVVQEMQRVEGELAFERAYQEAGRRLYPDAKIIDTSLLERRTKPAKAVHQVASGDRILWFTRAADCPECDSALPELLSAAAARDLSVDIFFLDTGSGDDRAIRAWAVRHDIPFPKVMARRITLNHDNGTAQTLGVARRYPVLVHRDHGGHHHEIRLSQLR